MRDSWQLTGTGPESYERYQVPSVFGPLAQLFIERVQLTPGLHVLDVACGTGVIARVAAPLLGPGGSITGVDLNAGMLEIARANAPQDGLRVEWKQADASALPFPDASWDVVLCQQGLQFFPDKAGALREMHRVLRPGGRVGLCVWRSVAFSPAHAAIVVALRRHLGEDVVVRFQAPFSFGDGNALHHEMQAAGFTMIYLETATLMRRLLAPEESIPGLLASTPIGPNVAALDPQQRQAIVSEVALALSSYRDADGFLVPQATYISQAIR